VPKARTADNAPVTARILSAGDPDAVAEAARAIRSGEPVAFPTETVYGLGANALDPIAVARVFEAKGRPRFDPLIVHLGAAAELERYADPDDVADPRVALLTSRFWPGPLTVVLRKLPVIPEIATAGLDTVGLRVPDHPVALRLIAEAGVPIAAPSANRFGGLSPTRAEHVRRQLGDRIALILDGGPSRIGVESTVVLLARGRAVLLRPGGLPAEAIEAEIGPLDPAGADRDENGAARSPGMSLAHYAPTVPLEIAPADRVLTIAPGERVGLLAANAAGQREALRRAKVEGRQTASGDEAFAAVETPAPDGDLLRFAAGLFEALHRLESAGLDRIVAQPVTESGIGRAIMDRLRRAAGNPGEPIPGAADPQAG
jgi:L-threonylcarbamoyladenylate synthase